MINKSLMNDSLKAMCQEVLLISSGLRSMCGLQDLYFYALLQYSLVQFKLQVLQIPYQSIEISMPLWIQSVLGVLDPLLNH